MIESTTATRKRDKNQRTYDIKYQPRTPTTTQHFGHKRMKQIHTVQIDKKE